MTGAGVTPSLRGDPGVPLAIGVDIGGTKVRGRAGGRRGHIVRRARRLTPSRDPRAVEATIAEVVEEVRRRRRDRRRRDRRGRVRRRRPVAGDVRAAPGLARRAAARRARGAARRAGDRRERRERRRLGGVALRRRARRAAAGVRDARHRDRRRHRHRRRRPARPVGHGGRVRPHGRRPRRPPLRVRQPRLPGAVRLRQRARPRGPGAGRAPDRRSRCRSWSAWTATCRRWSAR